MSRLGVNFSYLAVLAKRNEKTFATVCLSVCLSLWQEKFWLSYCHLKARVGFSKTHAFLLLGEGSLKKKKKKILARRSRNHYLSRSNRTEVAG